MEQMPMWCPPTPPQQETDVYMDQTMTFLYNDKVMSESQLPPIYVKKDVKRRLEGSFGLDYRRPLKIPRKEETSNAPRSLFHSPALLKMRRDLKLQKYRGLIRPSISVPGKPNSAKPANEQSIYHNWTIHEDMALLKVIQTFQGLPLNLIVMSPGQTPNWDFVADYVNTVSITYRSPKQCRQRYETYLMHREEGKYTLLDSAMRKKKKSGQIQKLPLPNKSRPSLRTSQLFTQDNNSTFSQTMAERFDTLKSITNKRLPTTRTVVNNPLMNKTKSAPVLNECGIDLEHPVLPVEVAARRAERIAKEKKTVTPEQMAKLQIMKGIMASQQVQVQTSSVASSTPGQIVQSTSGVPIVSLSTSQVIVSQAPVVVTAAPVITTVAGTPPSTLRPQRIIASPLQTSTVVSVSGLSPAQLQAATQRLIVSAGTGGQTKTVVGSPAGVQGKQFSQAQLQMIRQASIKNQLRLHNNIAQGAKSSTVTIGGQQTVVQFTQAQPRAQFIRQGTVTVGGKTGVTRTVTESEVAQLLKKQHQLQQQKLASGNVGQASSVSASGNTIHGITTQVFAQAIQQAGTSGTPVATLVKAVPSSTGVSQTVTIPVTGVTLTTPGGKGLAPTLKTTTPQQLRHMQIQQQLLTQKKIASGQKLSIAQVGGKNNVQTQLIVGSKPLPGSMTVQQFQQVIRTPLNVSQGPVVLAKGTSRVIPVNTGPGTKQTIQVVAASSQALSSALRPQGTTTIAGIKLQGTSSTNQQALLSQVSAALNQNVAVRQNSPVRIQTASGQPIVAVTVQSPSQSAQSQTPNPDQDSSVEYPGWTKILFLASAVTVLGCSLPVGYTIAVINTPGYVIKQFCNESAYRRYSATLDESTIDILWSSIVSVLLIGGTVGSLSGSVLANRVGRRGGLTVSSVLGVIAGILFWSSKSADSVEMLCVGRFFAGLSAGLITTIMPMYLMELSPPHLKGATGALCPLGLVFGELLGQIFSMYKLLGNENNWPLCLALSAFLQAFCVLVIPMLPESPKYLYVLKKQPDLALKELKRIRNLNEKLLTEEIEVLRMEDQVNMKLGETWNIKKVLKSDSLSLPLLLVCSLHICQQLSGVNAVFYYSSIIFKSVGLSTSSSELATIGAGCCNLFMGAVSIQTMSWFQRRTLIQISLISSAFFLIMLGISITFMETYYWMAYLCIVGVLGFVLCYGLGLGPIPYFVGSELFEVGPRSSAMALGSMANWGGNFIVGLTFPTMESYLGGSCFFIFAAFVVALLLFVRKYLPETKGKDSCEIFHLVENGFKSKPLIIQTNIPTPIIY